MCCLPSLPRAIDGVVVVSVSGIRLLLQCHMAGLK